MKIHRISDRELENLKIPIQKYEEDSGFKDFKMKAQEILGEKSFSCMKYLFMIYILIDLYSLKSPDRKNIIVKTTNKNHIPGIIIINNITHSGQNSIFNRTSNIPIFSILFPELINIFTKNPTIM